MDYPAAITYLDSHIALGVKPGLERMKVLMEFLGEPAYPMIHIAGTNGKTSTARLATMQLVAHGLNTGTYISPHLEAVEERYAINGRTSTREEFALAISDVAAFAEALSANGHEPLTYFELTTGGAFSFFADQAVNAAVVEVGLGGRLDATNVIDADVAVVTGIAREHVEYLGEDIAGIAREKLAIAGLSSILVTGILPEEAEAEAVSRARDLGIQHRVYGRDFRVLDAVQSIGGWLCTIEGAEGTYEDVFVPLHGRHQTVNLAVAVAATEALLGRSLDADAVRDGAAAVTVPGRLEPLIADPLLILDGAHNPDGTATMTAALTEEFPSVRWTVVLGVMGDKDAEAMTGYLAPMTDHFVVTAPRSARAVASDDLGRRVREVTDIEVTVVAGSEDAVDIARGLAGPKGAVLVTGSLYLVGEARSHLLSEGDASP